MEVRVCSVMLAALEVNSCLSSLVAMLRGGGEGGGTPCRQDPSLAQRRATPPRVTQQYKMQTYIPVAMPHVSNAGGQTAAAMQTPAQAKTGKSSLGDIVSTVPCLDVAMSTMFKKGCRQHGITTPQVSAGLGGNDG